MSAIHQPGEIIQAKYRLTGILGRGGVAITYRAIDLETNSPVAIKVISLKQLDNWKQIELFQREAEVLKQLNHPYIPSYLDYFDLETDTDKAFYLVQQLAPGKSLHQLIESGWRTNEREVKQIAQQILEILTYLHSLDPPVIHRDIKPSNLIRGDDGKIYLVDFGAVQNTYYNTLMQGSTVVGTYGYMSPEQFRGQAWPATDLYSLGATLLYLLTHRSPAELPQDTLKLDFRSAVNISEEFFDWLEKILEPDIEDRFSDANIALVELFKSKQKKQKKLISNLATVVLAIGLIACVNPYKWVFLSRLGYTPSDICLDKNVVESYINKGGKIDILAPNKSRYGKEPILNCIINLYPIEAHEKNRLVRLAIVKGSDVNQKDEDGYTPLLLAVRSREDLDTVKLLLENGANPNIKNNRDETPLLITRNKDIAKILIEHGADVNIIDKRNNNTPLFYAISNRDLETAKILIEYDANTNAINKQKYTVLHKAVASENIDMVKLLIGNGADVKIDKEAFDKAAYEGNIGIFKLLLKNGADAQAKIKYEENTILFSAASGGNIEIVKLLIEHGADAKLKNKYYESPLAHVTTKEIAELLIEKGADVNAQKQIKRVSSFSSTFPSNPHYKGQIEYGSTPLMNAINRENIEIIKLLLENGAEVNTRRNNVRSRGDKMYISPLFQAVFKKNLEIVKLLIKHEANVSHPNGEGKNILFYADAEEIAKLLIDNGADVNFKDSKKGDTALFELRNPEVIQLLIDRGADVNYRNKLGETPIFRCYYANKMQLLIDNGADVNVKNSLGETPLFGCIDKIFSREDGIQVLIDRGADINAKSLSGKTPISTAVYLQNKQLVQLLLDLGADTSYLDSDKIREVHKMNDKKYSQINNFLKKNKFTVNKK